VHIDGTATHNLAHNWIESQPVGFVDVLVPQHSAILSQPALGTDPNPLASLGGIHAKPQFHLPPVFRPIPHVLT